MPHWIKITPSHLFLGKAAKLVDAARTRLLADGQPDPAPEVILDVVTEIRNEIASCEGNRLDLDPETIPPELKSAAVGMALFRLQARLNVQNTLPLSDDDREDYKRHVRRLERIARCELKVSQPETPIPADVQSTDPGPRIQPRPLKFRDQYGI